MLFCDDTLKYNEIQIAYLDNKSKQKRLDYIFIINNHFVDINLHATFVICFGAISLPNGKYKDSRSKSSTLTISYSCDSIAYTLQRLKITFQYDVTLRCGYRININLRIINYQVNLSFTIIYPSTTTLFITLMC